ncbi:MAG: M2 family metallopeptidase [Flavobacteriales bacterium]|nr:M2 family metallopeptidase [Flavobacteriales bacterium]
MKYLLNLLLIFILMGCQNEPKTNDDASSEVETFLNNYNQTYQKLLYEASKTAWVLNTKIVEGDTMSSFLAGEAEAKLAEFTGSVENIEKTTKFLNGSYELTDKQEKQLEAILYGAGSNPQTVKDVVDQLIKANNAQTESLYGYSFMLDGKEISPNQIDSILDGSNDLKQRLAVWKSSKDVGKGLKDGLVNLRDLRNKSVQALNYDDFFSYQVSEYGMTTAELREVCQKMINDIWPLYRELHTWARYELAKKYDQPVPEMIPAHWLPNRWGQDWTGLVDVEGLNVDKALNEKSAEWIVKEGEKFYVSMGFPQLPQSFYEKSSLYPLPANADYKKNNHASAWHLNNADDVRSLMSVEPNTRWWETTLHELGHIYYYMMYSNPDVPIVLRGGANRAYHEAMGSLIGLASLQPKFLEQYGLIEKDLEIDQNMSLLKEALNYVVLIPWAAGVMTEFEYSTYSESLPADQYNKKWWELKEKYQGIASPEVRGEDFCDAASKTHINNDPAQYYDYAMSYILLFQFHDHISKNILKQDPHNTNYYGNKEVGKFLKDLMYPGASVDWRSHLKSSIGQDMSAQPMVDYFSPLMEYLQEQNKGREYTLQSLSSM